MINKLTDKRRQSRERSLISKAYIAIIKKLKEYYCWYHRVCAQIELGFQVVVIEDDASKRSEALLATYSLSLTTWLLLT